MRLLLLAFLTAFGGASMFAEDDYYPLHVGDEWTYAVAVINDGITTFKYLVHERTRSTMEKDGKIYFEIEQWADDPMSYGPVLCPSVRKDKTGIYFTGGKEDATESKWFPLPLKRGASWKKGEEFTWTVKGLESVTIGSKTYKRCYHLRTTSSDEIFTVDRWFAPGIGLVKSESAFKHGGKDVQSLTEFKSGK